MTVSPDVSDEFTPDPDFDDGRRFGLLVSLPQPTQKFIIVSTPSLNTHPDDAILRFQANFPVPAWQRIRQYFP